VREAFTAGSSSATSVVGMPTTAALLAQPVVAVSVPGGRIGPTIAALVGLAAVGIGWRTFRRHDRFSSSPTTVVGIGVATVVAGGVFLVLADGGPGTGNGVVGSSAAVTLGLVAVLLGVLARTRRGRVA
jgi:hypothetical protein